MRLQVELDGALVAQVDDIAGPRGRSAFVRDAVRDAVDRRHRQSVLLPSAGVLRDGMARPRRPAPRSDVPRPSAGVLRDGGHEWDDDPAAWVARQRSGDPRRVG